MGKKIPFYLTVAVIACVNMITSHASALDNKTDNGTTTEQLIIENDQIKVQLKSALILALKNNLSIKFESLKKDIDETEIMREKGKYDTLFSGQWNKNRSVSQVGSALGSSSSPTVMQERYTLDTKLQKKFTPGTQAEIKMTHEEFMTDVPFQGLKPQYKGELIASITQPLLKDFGISIGKSMIRIANLNYQMSQNEFKKKVMDILYQVESAYWDLYFSMEDLASKEKSLQRAENLRREFKIRIDAGTLAPIEIYQAEAEVALRQQEVIVAQAAVKEAEDRLKTALNLYDNERYWNITLLPMDKPMVEKTVPDLTRCVKTALEKRPDIIEAKLGIKAADIQVKYSKNQTLPRVDLIGSLGTSGMAGRPASTAGAFGLLYPGMKSPWEGHWKEVHDYMDDGDYYSYLIGIKIEFPLENRVARSQYAKAKLQSAQAVTGLKNMENEIINEVRDAVRRVETSRKLIESATASLRLAQEKLKAEEKKYSVGMSTAHDVLEFQEDLAKAESTLAFAETSYSKAIANLARVQGTLLEEKGLMMETATQ